MDSQASSLGGWFTGFASPDSRSQGQSFACGRPNASREDVKSIAKTALRHRVLPSFFAESEGLGADQVIDHLIETVSV